MASRWLVAGCAVALLAGCAGNPAAGGASAGDEQPGWLGRSWDKARALWDKFTDTVSEIPPGKALEWGVYAYVANDFVKTYFSGIVQKAAYAGALYYILDPWSPNWSIEMAPVADKRFRLTLRMKRHYSGGAGEAHPVFVRQAQQMAKEGKFANYRELSYTESIESSVLGSQRIATGEIALVN